MIIYIVVGLIGALLMFCGDMALYYTSEDSDYKTGSKEEAMQSFIDVMKKVPEKRLTVGGLIGPIAAFLYCIGFYHIIEMTNDNWKIVSVIAFLTLCLGIISGGAFHSHFVYIGLLGDDKYKDIIEIVINYFSKLAYISLIGEGIGFLLLIILIVTGNTVLPSWMGVISPGVLYLLKKPVSKLPKRIKVIVSGGWNNIISVIYYSSVLIYMCSIFIY